MPAALTAPSPRYRPRSATNDLKEIVEDHMEELFRVYDERFRSTCGPLHPRIRELFERFVRCGDPHFGFMRLHCDQCGEEKYVPHSCKARGLCPSCGQKRAIAWAERMAEEVLPDIPYVGLVLTIPKILRKAFLFKPELYGKLCRCAYAAIREFLAAHYPRLEDPIAAVVSVPQSFGSLLLTHAHIHALSSMGVYDREGNFHPAPDDLDFSPLEELFREKTFQMLLDNDATTQERLDMLRRWRHSGFQVNARRRISEGEREELEKLLEYMLRPPVSLRRLSYGADGMVTYRGNFHPGLGRDYQYVSGVEFLAMLVPHIQLRFQSTIYSYGALSTTIRRKFGWFGSETPATGSEPKTPEDEEESEENEFVRQRKKNWARLIAKTWLEDPEVCPKCGAKMRVVAAISSPAQEDVIEKILRYRGEWDPPWKRERRARGARGPPQPAEEDFLADELDQTAVYDEEKDFSQLPPEGADDWGA